MATSYSKLIPHHQTEGVGHMRISISTALLVVMFAALLVSTIVRLKDVREPILFQNFDDKVRFWLSPDQLDRIPSWDPRTTPPSMSFADASRIAFEIQDTLNSVPCEHIDRWETASICVVSLDGPFYNERVKKKWCYAALFIAICPMQGGPPLEFVALINFDGTAIVPDDGYQPHTERVLEEFGGRVADDSAGTQ